MRTSITMEDAIVDLLGQGAKDLDQIFEHLRCNGCPKITPERLRNILENLGKAERTVFSGGMYKTAK